MATSSTAKRTRLAMWMAMFEDDCAVCCNGGGMDGAKGSERPINAGPTNGLPTAGCCPWPQNTSGRVQSYKYETTDRRAGCGRSASPVRREGQGSIPRPYPYRYYAQDRRYACCKVALARDYDFRLRVPAWPKFSWSMMT